MNKFAVNPVTLLLIGILAAIIYVPFSGIVPLFDWDEINFAESAREMLVSGDLSRVTINFHPFWEKPPLYIWLQALSMKVFGVNEFAARFPNSLAAITTLCSIYYIGKRYFHRYIGENWALVYAGSIFPSFYFNTGLIDPIFNLFIFLGIFQIYLAFEKKDSSKNIFTAGLFTGLAILTKGPVAVLVTALTYIIFSIYKRNFTLFRIKKLLIYSVTVLLISSLWFVPETIKNGFWFIQAFFEYQIQLASQGVAGHGQPFYYHFVVLLIGCFPASILAFSTFKNKSHFVKQEQDFKEIMVILLIVVLGIFSAVTTKIIHYSSLAWFPITFLAGVTINSFLRRKTKLNLVQKISFGLLSILWLIIFSALPIIGSSENLKLKVTSLINDKFTVENLMADVHWTGFEIIPVLIFAVFVFRAIYLISKNRSYRASWTILISFILFLTVFNILVMPKIQRHVQGSMVDFYKSVKNKNAYVESDKKSYAQYFYSEVKPLEETDAWYIERQNLIAQFDKEYLSVDDLDSIQRYKLQWMINGPIDKDVYIVCRITESHFYMEHPDFTLVDEGGGYSMFLRKFKKNNN